jgi:hypothetical protein
VSQQDQRNGLRQTARFLLPASACAFVISFFLRDRLPDKGAILPSLRQDPVQTDTDLPGPFDVTRKGVTYLVEPVFNYELWGMVVSYHHADSFVDLAHEMWNDHVNIKDVCVIWGKNVETGVYRRMKFRSRDFTCFYRYPDQEAGDLFSADCLSNNHLLGADPVVSRRILKARKGDQIHLSGWLVSYGQKDASFRRGTSTVRTDHGDGACETVFVKEFEVLEPANLEMRALNKISIALMVLCAGVLFFL